MVRDFMMKWASLAASAAAFNSNLGSVSCFSGAALVLDISIEAGLAG